MVIFHSFGYTWILYAPALVPTPAPVPDPASAPASALSPALAHAPAHAPASVPVPAPGKCWWATKLHKKLKKQCNKDSKDKVQEIWKKSQKNSKGRNPYKKG